jgi:hypothetical protein
MAEVGAALITPVFAGLIKGTWAKLITSWNKPNAMAAFLRSGTNTTTVAHLAACLSGLVPLKEYDEALKLDAALHGTHNSTFLSNMMGPLVPTTTVSTILSLPVALDFLSSSPNLSLTRVSYTSPSSLPPRWPY